MSHLDGLNEQQRKAATHTKGPLLVVAGAGTGKTKTIVHRILNLVHTGVNPRSILALTFTNKAAQEMRERIESQLSSNDGVPTVCTFHSLGVRILREHHRLVGVNRYFTILDSQDTSSLIKEAMKELDIDTKLWEPRKISSAISRAKGDKQNPETYPVTNNPLTSIVKPVWARYEELKKASKALDFADLLAETYQLLSKHSEVLETYQKRWEYLHVDEYQDTNTIQYGMVKLLTSSEQNICAVGDGDQNIYSWRGADMSNILNFEKDFPGAEVILLEQNYRSTGRILQAAHEIISKNTERVEKKLVTSNGEGNAVTLYQAFSAHQEADWVAQQVKRCIEDGVEPGEIAVLFRTNFQSRILEESFLQYLIPYHVVGVKFFSRKEVKDLMSYIRAALNPGSLADIRRIINEPKRGIGKVSVAKIFAGQEAELSGKAEASYRSFTSLLSKIARYAEEHAPSETIKYTIQEAGFQKMADGSEEDQERFANMKELVTFATKYDMVEHPLEQFLEEVSLLSDQDSLRSEKGEGGTVKLMTIHASKGLEFDHVFVVGLEQGLFPSQGDDSKNRYEEEEERRLCYVAFTRAKKQLHLSYAQLRTIYGQQRINEPSEFIRDLSPETIDIYDDTDEHQEVTSYLDF